MPIFDSEGNELQVTVMGSNGWTVNSDGTVDYFSEDAEGNREEWTEQLCDSPVREVVPQWIWDLMDDAIDPRND